MQFPGIQRTRSLPLFPAGMEQEPTLLESTAASSQAAVRDHIQKPGIRPSIYQPATILGRQTDLEACVGPINPDTVTTVQERQQLLSLCAKLQAYFHMLGNDPQYGAGFWSMFCNQLGDGLMEGGGCLYLMHKLATVNPALSVVGFAAFGFVERLIAAISWLNASHHRDNTEQSRRSSNPNPSNNRTFGYRLVQSGGLDALGGLTLLLGAAGDKYWGFNMYVLFGLLVFVKGLQSFNKSFETGAWSCLKYNLGSEETQRNQLRMRSTIGSIELGIGGMTYGVVSLASTLLLTYLSPTSLSNLGLITVSVGTVMSATPKVFFGYWASCRPIASSPIVQ